MNGRTGELGEEALSCYMKGDMKSCRGAIDRLKEVNPEAADRLERQISGLWQAEKERIQKEQKIAAEEKEGAHIEVAAVRQRERGFIEKFSDTVNGVSSWLAENFVTHVNEMANEFRNSDFVHAVQDFGDFVHDHPYESLAGGALAGFGLPFVTAAGVSAGAGAASAAGGVILTHPTLPVTAAEVISPWLLDYAEGNAPSTIQGTVSLGIQTYVDYQETKEKIKRNRINLKNNEK